MINSGWLDIRMVSHHPINGGAIMLYVKCIHKFRDKNNNIIGYRLQDLNGQVQDVKTANLKNAIKAGNVHVVNLKLTADNRLIDSTEKVLKNTKVLGEAPTGIRLGKLPDGAVLRSTGLPLVPVEKVPDLGANREMALNIVTKVLTKVKQLSKHWKADRVIDLSYVRSGDTDYIHSIKAQVTDEIYIEVSRNYDNTGVSMAVHCRYSSSASIVTSYQVVADTLDDYIKSVAILNKSGVVYALDHSDIYYDCQGLDDGELTITCPYYDNLVEAYCTKDGTCFDINNEAMDAIICTIHSDNNAESFNKIDELIPEKISEFDSLNYESEKVKKLPDVYVKNGVVVDNK